MPKDNDHIRHKNSIGMNLTRLRYKLEAVLHGHILNMPWHNRMSRRKRRGEANQKYICQYLCRYAPYIKDIPEDDDANIQTEKERIFSIWLQGEDNAPRLIKSCFASIRDQCQIPLVVLDSESLHQWINLPDHIIKKWQEGKIGNAHFADICRVELLYRYGGVWMDSTCFATSKIPQKIMDEDFFIYMCNSMLISYSFVQNCFFRAKRHNYLLKVWRAAIFAYWEHENSMVDYFAHQLLFKISVENNIKAGKYFALMPKIEQEPTHALWWNYRDKPFDSDLFNKITSGAFFQKTEYKSNSARNPAKGSFSYIMQNKMYDT